MDKRIKKFFIAVSFILGTSLSFSVAAINNSFKNIVENTVETNATITANDPGTYYDNLDYSKENKGAEFRSDLATLITNTHTKNCSYSGLADLFPESDADTSKTGYIKWFYTGTSIAFDGSFSGNTNREHVWPKNDGNAFPAKTGPGSDGHHLRPTNNSLNSTRSSLNFDEVDKISSNIVAENGSKSYGDTADELCYKSGSFFYPAKGYRGATARILMYLQTRWGDQYSLSFVDYAGSSKTIGKISTLLKWHIQEPPSQDEYLRNQVVYEYQGNRNPFIDHPEFASKIYCYDGNSYNDALLDVIAEYGDYGDGDVESIKINPIGITLEAGKTRQFTISEIVPANASKSVTWESSDNSIATIDQNGLVTAVGAGKAIITATSTVTPSVSATSNLTVTAAKVLDRIEVSGSPKQTSYYEGDLFEPDGLVITAYYKDESSSVLDNSSCSFVDGVTGNQNLSAGTTSIKISYGGKTIYYEGIHVFIKPSGSEEFTLADNISDLVVGSKVIIANNSNNVAAGALNGAFLSSVSATISGNVITSESALEFILGKSGDYYTFSYNDQLLGCTAVKKLAFGSGDTNWSISFDSSGNVTMDSSTTTYGTMYYNQSAPRFTTYTSSGQAPISLYVASNESTHSTLDEVVEALKMDQYVGEITRPSGDCRDDFALARSLVLSLSAEDLNTFKTSSIYADALARYLMWAEALNENPWSFAPLSNDIDLIFNDNSLLKMIMIVGIAIPSTILIFAMIKTKKHN